MVKRKLEENVEEKHDGVFDIPLVMFKMPPMNESFDDNRFIEVFSNEQSDVFSKNYVFPIPAQEYGVYLTSSIEMRADLSLKKKSDPSANVAVTAALAIHPRPMHLMWRTCQFYINGAPANETTNYDNYLAWIHWTYLENPKYNEQRWQINFARHDESNNYFAFHRLNQNQTIHAFCDMFKSGKSNQVIDTFDGVCFNQNGSRAFLPTNFDIRVEVQRNDKKNYIVGGNVSMNTTELIKQTLDVNSDGDEYVGTGESGAKTSGGWKEERKAFLKSGGHAEPYANDTDTADDYLGEVTDDDFDLAIKNFCMFIPMFKPSMQITDALHIIMVRQEQQAHFYTTTYRFAPYVLNAGLTKFDTSNIFQGTRPTRIYFFDMPSTRFQGSELDNPYHFPFPKKFKRFQLTINGKTIYPILSTPQETYIEITKVFRNMYREMPFTYTQFLANFGGVVMDCTVNKDSNLEVLPRQTGGNVRVENELIEGYDETHTILIVGEYRNVSNLGYQRTVNKTFAL